ncbi:MAG: TMEM175 family protein [Asticcacaulis sp.]
MSQTIPGITLGKGRIEAFSDGVLAIIITIMVLELHTPAGHDLSALAETAHTFLLYALSFIYVGIYWNNHHHLLHTVQKVNGGTLWANLHLLFWLSLVPFTTRWMGESDFATIPTAVYGLSLLMPSIAYYILVRVLIAANGKDSLIKQAIGKDTKGMISTALYMVGIALTFWNSFAGIACYVLVALIWLVPDRRIEH